MSTRVIPYEELAVSDDSPAAREFVERMHEHGFAILRFPADATSEVAALRSHAGGFFALPAENKRAIGDFKHVGDTYAGYRDSASIDAEFLEVHTLASGGTFPELGSPPGMSEASAALFRRLDGMSRRLLELLATVGLGVDSQALLAPLDPPTNGGGGASASAAGSSAAPAGESAGESAGGEVVANGSSEAARDISSSVLRVCHYRRRDESGGGRGGGVEVLFDEHTDSSFITLSTLCPGAPGLQLRDASVGADGGWLDVETLAHVTGVDVEVHVGDFLSFSRRITSRRACIE